MSEGKWGRTMKSYTKLTVRWSKREKDLVFSYPAKCDGSLAHYMFCGKRMHANFHKSHENPFPWDFDALFVKELEKRGYDLTTLKFSIEKKTVSDVPAT